MQTDEQRLRILIADDHAVVREGLAAIIATQKDMHLVGQATDGEEAVALIQALDPDVILLDLMMPRKDGLEVITTVMRRRPSSRILVLTSFAHDDRVFPAIKAGALGYLLKDATHDQLLQAIRNVARGETTLAPEIALRVMREIAPPSPPAPRPTEPLVELLTEREMETLRLVAQGLTNKEIAEMLVLHERTIAKYVSSILQKLSVANRTQAALYALREGISQL